MILHAANPIPTSREVKKYPNKIFFIRKDQHILTFHKFDFYLLYHIILKNVYIN